MVLREEHVYNRTRKRQERTVRHAVCLSAGVELAICFRRINPGRFSPRLGCRNIVHLYSVDEYAVRCLVGRRVIGDFMDWVQIRQRF